MGSELMSISFRASWFILWSHQEALGFHSSRPRPFVLLETLQHLFPAFLTSTNELAQWKNCPHFGRWKTRSRCQHPLKKCKVMVKPTKKHKDPFHPFPLLSLTWSMRRYQNTEQELQHLSFKETQYSQFTTGTVSSSGWFPWLMKLGINIDLQFGQRRVTTTLQPTKATLLCFIYI